MIVDNKKYFIDDRIFSNKFACNLERCKGGCCTIKSELGAPLLEDEIGIIKNIIDRVKPFLSDRNLKVIENNGFYFRDGGKIYLNNVNDEDCVFSYITEDGIALCAIEKAYRTGEIDFRKPISCELFPIRIYGEDRDVLRYEKMNECDDAVVKGTEINISVFEFLKEAVERAFGKEFYNKLKNLINEK